jgi:hypothetical protein
MVHQITIPEEMWQWAEDQSRQRGEGPASFLRAVIIGAMAQAGTTTTRLRVNNHPTPQQPQRTTTSTRQAIIDVLEGRRIYAHGCKAILQANDWDYIDPAQMMQKPPEDVLDFLQSCSYEAGMYADMFASRRNLLKMIFDAYLRAHGGYREG